MINANELRIGNWVSDDDESGEIFKVETIQKGEPPFTGDNYFVNGRIIEDINPIPLTEDWHNKFGVIKDGFNQFEYKYAVGKSIIFTGDYVYLLNTNSINGERSLSDHICTLWNKDIERRDMYVHEWQNLYFALTGEELTINL